MKFEFAGENRINETHQYIQTFNLTQNKVRELLMDGRSIGEIISAVIKVIEKDFPEILATVHIFDPHKNLLKVLASPGMPDDLVKLMDGRVPGPEAGSCSMAIWEKRRVISSDISQDPSWRYIHPAFINHGLKACWSQPIFSYDKGNILGTFAMYFRQVRKPKKEEIALLDAYANLVGTAMEWNTVFTRQTDVEVLLEKTKNVANLILENINIGIIGIDKKGVNTFTNQMAYELLGFSSFDLLNKNSHELIHHTRRSGEKYAIEECPIYKVLQTGKPVYVDNEVFWRKDGTSFPVEYKATPIIENNDIIGVVLCFCDITERVRDKEKLKENEEQFRMIAEYSSDMIIILDLSAKIEYVSPSVETIVGYRQDEVTGRSAFEFYHPDDVAMMKKVYKYISESNEVTEKGLVHRIRNKEGKYIWVETKGKAIRNEKGDVIRIHSVNRDISERKKIERSLEKESEYFRAVLENINDGIIACDEKGEIFFLNDAAEALHGQLVFNPDANTWSEHYNLYAPGCSRQLEKEEIPLYKAFFQEKNINNEEVWICPEGGSCKTTMVDGRPIYDNSGKKIGAVVVLHDVTDLKKSEIEIKAKNNMLKAQEEEFRILAEAASDVISTTTPEGDILYISPSVEAITGYLPDEIVGRNAFEFYLPEHKEKMRELYRKTSETGEAMTVTYQIFSKSGEVIWFEASARGLKDENGKINSIHMVNRDVTQRKNIEDRLEQETEYLKAILDNVNEGIAACNEEGELVIFNRTARNFHGLPDNAVSSDISRESFNIYDKHGKTEIMGKDLPLFMALEGKEVRNSEFRICPPHLPVKIVLVDGQPIFNKEGKKLGAVIVIHDITERKKAEKELRAKNADIEKAYGELKSAEESLRRVNIELESRVLERTQELLNEKQDADKRNAELKRINTDLDNFIYTASHDLKSPITNIEGLLHLFKSMEAYESKDIRPIVDMMTDSVERFKKTITELTEVTKSQKSFENDDEWISLEELFEDVKAGLKQFLESTGSEVVCNFHQVKQLSFSRKNMRSILYNLLSNAIKYRSPNRKARVNVFTERADGYIVLNVEDNGLGISAPNIHKIFTMFKRLHNHVEGTGIGLYLVKRIVENAGGRIEVESELGKGSVFKIYFKDRGESI